ncbi:hypothetical protein A4S06_08415 [Erysipelotrichaceae bacterium MTC7]|nr:hypothetical protein A4S06_08415 [Erysipelotrichaceae bacterium MTC7]
MKKIKVSVVIPFYNVENYIERCMESLKSQTLKEIEFIIVDDGSKDASRVIVERYLDDSRFKLYTKENGGLSDARNFGMQYVQGEYMCFLDSDDYVDSTMYETMYNKAIEKNLDMVSCDFVWEFEKHCRKDQGLQKNPLLLDVRAVVWNKMFRTAIIKEHKLQFIKGLRYEDVAFTYIYIPYIERYELLSEPFVHYIQRDGSIVNTQNEKVRDIYTILDHVFSYYKNHQIYEAYEEQLEYVTIRYIFGSSLKRIVKIEDAKLRNQIIMENWEYLNERFPNWRNNRFLRNQKTMKNTYMKLMKSRNAYLLSARILRHQK